MKKKYRGIIIGSSMAMPRLEVSYDNTWIAQVNKKFEQIEFIDKCRRASTSERLVSDGAGAGDKIRSADLLEYYNPDFVITQIGVTDCAPRLYNKNSFFSYLFHFTPEKFNKTIIKFLKKYRGRDKKYSYVSPSRYRDNWLQYFERCKNYNVQIICILISIPTKLVSSKSPEIEESIDLYNSILIDLSRKYANVHLLIPFDLEEIESTAIDEFHVGVEGHVILANKIEAKIKELYN